MDDKWIINAVNGSKTKLLLMQFTEEIHCNNIFLLYHSAVVGTHYCSHLLHFFFFVCFSVLQSCSRHNGDGRLEGHDPVAPSPSG